MHIKIDEKTQQRDIEVGGKVSIIIIFQSNGTYREQQACMAKVNE